LRHLSGDPFLPFSSHQSDGSLTINDTEADEAGKFLTRSGTVKTIKNSFFFITFDATQKGKQEMK
jgi:hypothetical protein